MRPFEFLVAVLLAIRIVGAAFPGLYRTRVLHLLPLAAVALIPLHILVEGYRWQMVPLYGLALLLTVASAGVLQRQVRPATETRAGSGLPWVGWGLALLVFLPALALPVVLAVPRLPPPGGPYAVGTQTVVLTDPERKEIFSNDPTELRRILYQVWYPAEPQAGDRRAPWMARVEVVGPAIARELGLPAFFLDHLALTEMNAYLDAPGLQTNEKFPVLLFSHGWTGFRAQNTHLMEELASRGYVVIGMEHPYGSMVTVFPDGVVIENNPEAIEGENANRLARQWAGDLALVLDSLTPLNPELGEASLAGVMLDLEHVGVFGHSTGAGAGIEFCAADPRCTAYLGLDPYLIPVSDEIIYTSGLDRPALTMHSQLWRYSSGDPRFNALRTRLHGDYYAFELRGANHYDFTDLPLLSPLAAQIGLKGPIPSQRVIEIVDAYTLAFFDQYLKGRPSDLLAANPPPFSEIQPR
jgi:predicted dienelactone hydrolase